MCYVCCCCYCPICSVVIDETTVVVGTYLYSTVAIKPIDVVVGDDNIYSTVAVVDVGTNLYSVVVVGAIVVVVVGTGSLPIFQDRLPFLSSWIIYYVIQFSIVGRFYFGFCLLMFSFSQLQILLEE